MNRDETSCYPPTHVPSSSAAKIMKTVEIKGISMNLHSLDIHRSFVHSTPPPRFVVNNHPSPLSFSTHFGAGEKPDKGALPRKEKKREGKGREEKKREALPNSSSYRITITKSGTIVRTTFHDSFLGRAEGSKTKVQHGQGSRHHGTIMGRWVVGWGARKNYP